MCLQSHSKPECRWTLPGVPISSAWQKGSLGMRLCLYSRPQKPRSFWSALRRPLGRSNFLTLRRVIVWYYQPWLWACAEWREVREWRTSGVGRPSQKPRYLVLTKRSEASEHENKLSLDLWLRLLGFLLSFIHSRKPDGLVCNSIDVTTACTDISSNIVYVVLEVEWV